MKRRILCAAFATVMMIAALCTMISCGGHEHSYSKSEKPATCTEAAVVTYQCECGDSYVEKGDGALGHALTNHSGKPATCTEAGYIPYSTCSRCSYSTEKTVLEATGHYYIVKEFNLPGFDTKGSKTLACDSCKDEIKEEIVSLGVSVPEMTDLVASVIEELSFTLTTSPDSVIIHTCESGDYTVADGEKTFYAIKLCDAKLFAEEKTPKGYLKFAIEKSVVAFDGTVDLADVVAGEYTQAASFSIYLEGDSIAIESDGNEKEEYVLSEYVFGILFGDSEVEYDDVMAVIYLAAEFSKCLPQLEELADALNNSELFGGSFELSESFEATLALFGESFFKKTANSDGSYKYETDLTAVRVLIDAFKDKTVEEAIDAVYGDGAANGFKNFIAAVPAFTLKEIADYAIDLAENFGFDVDGIFGLIELMVYQIGDVSISIRGELAKSGNVTIAELMSSGSENFDINQFLDEWEKTVNETFGQICGYKVETLLNLMIYGEENPDVDTSVFDLLLAQLEEANSQLYLVIEFSADGVLENVEIRAGEASLTIKAEGEDIVLSFVDSYGAEINLVYGPAGFEFTVVEEDETTFEVTVDVEKKADGTYYVGELISNGNDLLDLNAVVANGELVSLDLVVRTESTLVNEETGEETYVVEDEVEVTYSRTEVSEGEYEGALVVKICGDKFGELVYTENASDTDASLQIFDSNGVVAVEIEASETTVDEVTTGEYSAIVYSEGFTVFSFNATLTNGELVLADVVINTLSREAEDIYDENGEYIDTEYGEYYIDFTANLSFEKVDDVSTIVYEQTDNIGFVAVYTALTNGGTLTIVGTDNEEVMLDFALSVTDEDDGIHVGLDVIANEFSKHTNEDGVEFVDGFEIDVDFVVAE